MKPAKTFKDLIVWQKAHRFVLATYSLILIQDMEYAAITDMEGLLEEVSKLLVAYVSPSNAELLTS